jgi:signal recognition particle receptor subunit beta
MAVFNHVRKEIDAKIVYCGPGVSGKTTNLQFIHQNMKPEQRGKIVSLATNEERTLFFDFLPIELDSLRGFKTRFHLYTVPGQVYYGATRRAVLLGVDGVIFVADSQVDKMEDNLISLKDLEENLRYYGKSIETIPLIIQYNKRDLANILTLEELNQKINRLNVPYFEAVAMRGKGVFETLTMLCRTVLKGIEAGIGTETKKYPGKPETAAETPAGKTISPGPSRPLQEPPRAKETSRPAILRQKPDKLRPEPVGQVNEKTRIISCGQPRILPPHSIQIPLTMEIDGLAKSFSVNIAINIKELTRETD